MYPPIPEKHWTAVGISSFSPVSAIANRTLLFLFKGHYLIVTTPGWHIVSAYVRDVLILSDVDGDAYSRDEHDRFERMGQLERHRLTIPAASVGDNITFIVSLHEEIPRGPREFRAVIIGEAVER